MNLPRQIKLRNKGLLIITRAEPKDAAEIIQFMKCAGAQTPFLTFDRRGLGISRAEEKKFIRRSAQANLTLVLKGVVGNRIASVLTLMRGTRPRVLHVAELGITVLKKHWGVGIGRHMIETSITWARRNKVRKINLTVRKDNLRAIRLYSKLGFKREGLRRRALLIAGKFHDEIVMGLCLD